jgi:hypothetical protein
MGCDCIVPVGFTKGPAGACARELPVATGCFLGTERAEGLAGGVVGRGLWL